MVGRVVLDLSIFLMGKNDKPYMNKHMFRYTVHTRVHRHTLKLTEKSLPALLLFWNLPSEHTLLAWEKELRCNLRTL